MALPANSPIVKDLHAVIAKTPGLLAIVVSDRDGLEIVRAVADPFQPAYTPNFAAVFSVVAEHADRLRIGPTRSACALYNNMTLVHQRVAAAPKPQNQQNSGEQNNNNNNNNNKHQNDQNESAAAVDSGVVVTLVAEAGGSVGTLQAVARAVRDGLAPHFG